MEFQTPLRQIKGVGEKTEKAFQDLGVYTVGDILLHFPRTYAHFSEPEIPKDSLCETTTAVIGILKTPAKTKKVNGRLEITTAMVFSGSHAVDCIWFHKPYLSRQLPVGEPMIFYGILEKEKQRYRMRQPAIYTPIKYKEMQKSLQPVYPLVKGLNQTIIRKILKEVFLELDVDREEVLPKKVCEREWFPSYETALQMIHFPKNEEEFLKGRHRLVYQEFFQYVLYSRSQKLGEGSQENHWKIEEEGLVETVIKQLPYSLTNAQQETLKQIQEDIRGQWISQRLIQGDVGSGKTIVAFLAMIQVAASGYQAAIMAPTEVLARQHLETFEQFCKEYQLPFPIICLTGSQTAKEKKQQYEKILSSPNALIIGTHALIQEKAIYQNLALVIVDEQHRFGVRQRELLFEKGINPHVIVMSATPIPRTLAMILYGNMQISAMREMPQNRIPIKTCVITDSMRTRAYQMIAEQIKQGHQAYIICPLVESNEKTDAENVLDYINKIKEYPLDFGRIEALHGRMPAKEKNKIMEEFSTGDISVLVSTTVVEVGVNVPNATVIFIENANRFGLAQLHQLRGRVGRGAWQSYCILMNNKKGKNAQERLNVMKESLDGFYIAQKDLKLRGPGELYGLRQSGELQFKLADIITDGSVLEQVSQDVADFLMDSSAENEKKRKLLLEEYEQYNHVVL